MQRNDSSWEKYYEKIVVNLCEKIRGTTMSAQKFQIHRTKIGYKHIISNVTVVKTNRRIVIHNNRLNLIIYHLSIYIGT